MISPFSNMLNMEIPMIFPFTAGKILRSAMGWVNYSHGPSKYLPVFKRGKLGNPRTKKGDFSEKIIELSGFPASHVWWVWINLRKDEMKFGWSIWDYYCIYDRDDFWDNIWDYWEIMGFVMAEKWWTFLWKKWMMNASKIDEIIPMAKWDD